MTRVTLSLRGRGLKNVAGRGRTKVSDPFAVVTLLAPRSSGGRTAPKILGKTETVYDNLSPDWTKTFDLDYELGQPQPFVVTVYDEKKKNADDVEDLRHHVEIARCRFELGSVLGSPGGIHARSLPSGGVVYASVEKSAADQRRLVLSVRGLKLANVDGGLFGRSDPFFEIYAKKTGPHGDAWDAVYRSEYVKDTLSPEWKRADVGVEALCGGDLDRPLRIDVFDHSKKGNFTPMGSCETTLRYLLAQNDLNIPCSFKMLEGKIVVTEAQIVGDIKGGDLAEKVSNVHLSPPPQAPYVTPLGKKPTFVDYLSGGCQLNLSVAIDFTGSNGDPRQPGTLHHVNPSSLNSYQKAILAVGPVLEKYDADRKYPVLGFGAKYDGAVRHCFQCGKAAEAVGVRGIMEAYGEVFRTPLTLSGPTVFTEVIQVSARRAMQAQQSAARSGNQVYSILLILTDGTVSDVMATKEAIGKVSDAPLSIIIVGVGNADFSAMQYLDDSSVGRDIVQFVEFQHHQHSKGSLTAATLNEIPAQLVQYFSQNGILPGGRVTVEEGDIVVSPEEEEIDLGLNVDDEGEIAISSGGYYKDGY